VALNTITLVVDQDHLLTTLVEISF